jgi:hypothetical protein
MELLLIELDAKNTNPNQFYGISFLVFTSSDADLN